MKKILSILLVAIMLLGIIPVSVSAASTPVIAVKADKSIINKGSIVTFTVSVSAKSNIVSLMHSVTYNSSEFEYVEESASANDTGVGIAAVSASNIGKINYAFASSSALTSGQTIYTFKLKAKKSTATVYAIVGEVYVNDGGSDSDVTSAVANASTKIISFAASSNDYIEIRKPSMTTIRYKDGIVLHADTIKTLPNNSRIEWTTSNGNFKTKTSSDGKTFTITSNSNGTTVITATLYSSSGSILEEESIEMTSKASFGDKIGGFFRMLFGATKTHAE